MKIDLDKFICSLMKRYYEKIRIDPTTTKCWLDSVLEDQGLEYKDGEIVEIEQESESEDERIRKDLIEWIEEFPDSIWRGHYTKDVIAWLERQSNSLPIWKYKKDHTPLLRDSLILNKYGCMAKSPSGAIVSDVWVIDYDELAKLPREEFEKQGEQKWSDEDECYMSECISAIATKDSWSFEEKRRTKHWLKSLKERMI